MSRTSLDARRSIKKYVTEFLPDNFDVRLSADEGVWERPSAVVESTTPMTLTGGPKTFEATRTFTIYAWPVRHEANVQLSEIEAETIEEAFVQALQIGGPHGGAPRRIPLWDYDGIALTAVQPADAELDGYLRVVDASVDKRRDPDDDAAWTVIGTMRVKWMRLGEGKEELVGPVVVGIGDVTVIPH